MSEPANSGPSTESVEDLLRGELAHGDAIAASARPVLRQLLKNDDRALFSDEAIARVRGMMVHIARQLLSALAREAGMADRRGFVDERENAIAAGLIEDARLLSHAHALTIEAQIADRLSQCYGLDQVLSPLLQEFAAAEDRDVAAAAMGVISAQERFVQQQRRMECPLQELPDALLETALEVLCEHIGDMSDAARPTPAMLREESRSGNRRTDQLDSLVRAIRDSPSRTLEVDAAGVAIFATALALASGQDRDTAILSLGQSQAARLGLGLRAAGLDQHAVKEQLFYLHPDLRPPVGLDELGADRAAALLAASQAENVR